MRPRQIAVRGNTAAPGLELRNEGVVFGAHLRGQLPLGQAAQFAQFAKLDPSQLAPGDLVFFEPKADGPGHVGMYVGGDRIVDAPHTGALVRYDSLSGYAAALGFLGAVRPYGPALATPRQLFGLQLAAPSTVTTRRGVTVAMSFAL